MTSYLRMFGAPALIATALAIVLGSQPAPVQAALVYDRIAPANTTVQYQFGFAAGTILRWRLVLIDVSVVPNTKTVIANGFPNCAPVNVAGNFAGLNPGHNYRLRLDVKLCGGGGAWILGIPTGVF